MSNDLIAELEEAVRREKLEKAFKDYGPYVAAGCAIAILFTGLSAGWAGLQKRTNAANTAAILAAAESPAAAQSLAEAATTISGDQALIAHLAAAGMFMQDGNHEQALSSYKDAAAVKGAPAVLRDLALLQAARLQWDKDSAGAQDILDQIKPLANDNKNTWNAHARLLAATITAQGLDDYAGARAWIAPVLAAPSADMPPSLLQRARALDHLYGMKGAQAAQTPATQG